MAYMTSFTRILVICLIAFSISSSQTAIPNSARNIQRDGFLLEWDAASAKPWGSWSWDAMATPEGLAGYFKSSAKNRCGKWEFKLLSGDDRRFLIVGDTTLVDTSFYRVSFSKKDSTINFVIEWLIPWNMAGGVARKYPAIKISGYSACNDTLPLLGMKQNHDQANLQRRIILQSGLIVLLAMALWIIKRRIHPKKRRAET